jgi:hypothetical protein
MEDEHQSTLRKKIQILFQLGKWPDVVKLCASYNEQYGKDMEIDLLRFKSERHMGIASPEPKEEPGEGKAGEKDDQPLSAAVAAPPRAAEKPQVAKEEKLSFESPGPEEIIIGDPFAEDGPGFSLAPEQPPVDMSGGGDAPDIVIPRIPALEMEGPADSPPPPADEEKEIDFSKFGGMAIDAEPELVPSRPPEPPAAPFSRDREEGRLEDVSRSISGRVDIVEEPKEEMAVRPPVPEPEEVPRRPGSLFSGEFEAEAPERKRAFNFKLALLAILPLAAALALWLALTGKLNFTGSQEEAAASQPVVQHPVGRRPMPVKKEASPPETLKVDEQEKVFDEEFQQAKELDGKGELLKAWAVLLEAKKIKVTEPLRLLEEQLANKIRTAEEKAKQATQVVESQWQMENDAFAKAEAANTIPAWKEFLKKYPDGDHALRAGKRIALLEKKAQDDSQQALLLRIQQLQRVKLRADSRGMNQGDIASMLRQLGKPPTQFEVIEHGGARVLLDFASGLMWTLWNKPMVYDKAKWWANRITAGYGGWRLPTSEEVLSLLQMDRAQYAGLPDFAVWTGDTVSDQPHTAWVLKIPEGQFLAKDYEQSYYVWAVRKAGK